MAIKCADCGAEMVPGLEDYVYERSGLSHIVLVGITIERCACGNYEAAIPHMDGLHRAIAWNLVGKACRLLGAEMRFLRKFLEWEDTTTAWHLDVGTATIRRWESGKGHMPLVAERLLRTYVGVYLGTFPAGQIPNFPEIALTEAQPTPIRLKFVENAWTTLS